MWLYLISYINFCWLSIAFTMLQVWTVKDVLTLSYTMVSTRLHGRNGAIPRADAELKYITQTLGKKGILTATH